MAVKSKTKSKSPTKKSKPAAKSIVKTKGAAKKVETAQKAVSSTGKKTTTRVKAVPKSGSVKKSTAKASAKSVSAGKTAPVTKAPEAARPVTHVIKRPAERRRSIVPASLRSNQFAFMKAPTPEHAFEVGDNVEVFCDHEKSRERVRGWVKGIVVQVDNKMVAVQFRSNVFLTDGWMVPDRILWYPLASEHIRPVGGKKAAVKKDFIPDY